MEKYKDLVEDIKDDLLKRKIQPNVSAIYEKKSKFQKLSYKEFIDFYYKTIGFDFEM